MTKETYKYVNSRSTIDYVRGTTQSSLTVWQVVDTHNKKVCVKNNRQFSLKSIQDLDLKFVYESDEKGLNDMFLSKDPSTAKIARTIINQRLKTLRDEKV